MFITKIKTLMTF